MANKNHSSEFESIADDARKTVVEVTVEDVAAAMKRPNPPVLVDVREDSEWAAGHIEGAIHLSKGVIERDIVERLPQKDQEIILYCGGGFRSALAAQNIQKMGYSKVRSMIGGIRAWKQKNK